MSIEETFTDKEFCRKFKIDRATSFRWREDGIVGFIKLPNGQIRYKESHITALYERFEKLALAPLDDSQGAVKGGVVDIGVAKGRRNVGVAQNA